MKDKGIAIEGGGSPRFDEADWAEVFKIVDSYGVGDVQGTVWDCGQSVMQVDLHSEGEGNEVGEGDSLHESEYGPEDEEDGKNRDEEGCKRMSSHHLNDNSSDFCVSEDDFDSEVGEYNPEHKCARSFHVKNVNNEWLFGKYEESFRTDPNRNVKGFRKDIIKYIRYVSKHQTYRAKRKALNAIEGRVDDQFDQLWNYAAELKASNPRSTVIMVMTEGDNGTDRRKFKKLYVCFDALRQRFLQGCMPVIGVDGCHLKGPHGGILLTVVLIDLNNNLYPLAYAIVSGETRESWQWFLELLKGDLNVVRDDTYTFISDKQKGLIPTFESVFPGATNRFCQHTCICRKWDLTGIPCNHGMSAICSQSLKPEDFVNPCYSIETFLEVYKYAILPVNGPQLWTKTGRVPPLPPNFGRRTGRPSKARRVEHDEPVHKGKKIQRGQKKQPTRLKRQPYQQSKKIKGVEVQATQTTSFANVPSRRITRSTPLPAATESNQATSAGGKQPLLHRFTQCSTVQNVSSSGAPYLTQGGKKFVTMKNLAKAVVATKKRALHREKNDADL
ncbi:UNVERIFIED_CONTAM: hypothetical protein Slati_0433100 [Sesamum latifolium]|uniref:SWIM-type domain-containing protein n=1 Tax=Sesamum latifolium TaxID=2727402 RepID=A0AAW2XVA6_9LAMI